MMWVKKSLALLLAVAPLHMAAPAPDVGWDLLWNEDLREPESPVPCKVQGSIPSWVDGSLIRNAGAQFKENKNSINSAFDGLAKVFKFAVHGGQVTFNERFLRTALFNNTRKYHKFPHTAMMEATEPPFKATDIPQPSLSDNTNIDVFPFHGEAIATTDSALYTRFNPDTLETIGPLKFPLATQGLSASHLHYLPGSDKSTIVNYYTNIIAVSNHEIQVFKMGADHKQEFFGKTTVKYLPYVHSFGLTKNHMLLFTYPLGFAEACTMEFKALLDCAKWYDHNATLLVFPLDGKEGDPPKMTVELSSHFSLHHVNAWEDDEAFFIDANSYFDGTIFLGKHVHADIATMRNQSLRDQVAPWSQYTRLRVDRATGTSSMQSIHLSDTDGYVYDFDFPVIHPEKDTEKHCVVWGITSFAKNSTEYAHWAVLRADVCSGAAANTIAWFEENQFPSEPVFVPRPGSTTEDDGVLLMQVVDGPKSTTYMLVLDAKTMKELARAYLPDGWSTPYTQHGNWFPAATKSVMV